MPSMSGPAPRHEGASEPAPASTPAAEPSQVPASEPAPGTGPAPFDGAAFETRLKEKFGPDISLTTLETHMEKMHRSNSKLGRELAELKKSNEPRDEFWKMIDSNEALRERLGQTVDEFFQEHQQPGAPRPDFGLVTLEQRLNQIETQQLTARTDAELSQMEAMELPVTPEMRDEIHATVLSSRGAIGAREAYWMKYGERVMRVREEAAAKAAVESIRQNNEAYIPAASQRTPAAPSQPARDVTGMSAAEFAEYATQRWRETMGPNRRW